MKRSIVGLFIVALCLIFAGCASMTPAQKRTFKVIGYTIALGSLAATIAAQGDAGAAAGTDRQIPSGCMTSTCVQ